MYIKQSGMMHAVILFPTYYVRLNFLLLSHLGALLERMAASGADVLSLDWTVTIPEVFFAKSVVQHFSSSHNPKADTNSFTTPG